MSGYVPYWDQERAFDVVHQQPATFTQISPMWYSLNRNGKIVLADDDNTDVDQGEVRFLQDSGILVLPTLTNLRNGDWEPALVRSMLRDGIVRRRHVDAVVELVERNGYDGIDIDYEDLRADDRAPYSEFLSSLGEALHRNGRLLTSSVYAKESEPGPNDHNIVQDYTAIASACDQVRVMTYDYHYSTSEPGPVAPAEWVEN
ncbi:MAG: glycosyl hydrolase family 18 protein, partial [Actinomycetota bacterium]|nr:glycosyl hydrolase family 18 protein [Actinomycetota bacterium]